ncbi:MAG: type II secretion system protein GspE [Gemmatimonadetes bacterium]|nr:type II secretion system protein GspE [Gemmatimonadota bacterium]
MTQNGPARVLGHYLLAAGVIQEPELQAAIEEQRRTRERIGDVLVRRGLAPEHLARALAAQLRLPYAESPLRPEAAALQLVDGTVARRLRVLPLRCTERALEVAMAEPLDLNALDDLRFRTGRRIDAAVAVPAAVDDAIAEAYHSGAVDDVLSRIGRAAPPPPEQPHTSGDGSELRRASEAQPIVALVELLLTRSIQLRASDIHVEASRVRARVDGVLRELLALPAHMRGAVVSRIKILAGLDIAVKRRAQDGRGVVKVGGREFALRVSTLPAQGGEKVVLRLLESSGKAEPLASLGMAADQHRQLLRLLQRSHGLILVTGPTGSGKTTTLYAALAGLDRDRRNILTLEDPVEYRLPGLTQVQVNRRAGLGFAAALRATLRQDPDVIMVGELRDRRTVQTAMAAALTGHLVLSTLHTNDAPSAAARLVEMGAPPYLVAATLVGVLAQRLARRLCPHCRVDVEADPTELLDLGLPPRATTTHVPRGCGRCDGAGYRGRIGIYELMPITPEVRERLLRRGSADALRETARAAGVRSLAEDAWLKVRAGWTSLEEVRPLLRVLGDEAPRCVRCAAPLRAGYAACPGCGAVLRARCACGALAEPQWRHCAECGAPLPQRD